VAALNTLNGASVMPPMEARTPAPEAPAAAARKPRRQGNTPKRSADRFKVLNEFVDRTMQQLTPRQTAVWLALFRDSRNGTATAAQSYIATRCGLKRPTVSTTIGELEALGLVVTIHHGGVNRGLSRYRVSGIVTAG